MIFINPISVQKQVETWLEAIAAFSGANAVTLYHFGEQDRDEQERYCRLLAINFDDDARQLDDASADSGSVQVICEIGVKETEGDPSGASSTASTHHLAYIAGVLKAGLVGKATLVEGHSIILERAEIRLGPIGSDGSGIMSAPVGMVTIHGRVCTDTSGGGSVQVPVDPMVG